VSEARFRFLSQEDVVAAVGLDVAATIDVVEEALRLHAEGDTRLPSKSALLWSDELGSEEKDGRIMAMPAYVGGSIALAGLKWIPSVPSNPSRGLPRGIGLILLTHRGTGLPVAVMDGTIVSAARTGAVTGVTAPRLARPGAHVVAILGAGVQAGTQLAALEAVLPGLDEVRVWDIAPERAEAFRERSDALVPVPSAEAACRGADVIVAATMAPEPYVPPEWLGPGEPVLLGLLARSRGRLRRTRGPGRLRPVGARDGAPFATARACARGGRALATRRGRASGAGGGTPSGPNVGRPADLLVARWPRDRGRGGGGSRVPERRGARARDRALALAGPDLDLILPQNSRLQFSHRKTRARTLRLWPPHRGHRRQVPATAQSIGSVVSPG
jgi:hypothetical protein